MKKTIYLLSLISTSLLANSNHRNTEEISEIFSEIVNIDSQMPDELLENIKQTIRDNPKEFLERFSVNLEDQDSFKEE